MREASPEIEEKRQRIEEVCCAKVANAPFTHSLWFANRFKLNHVSPFTRKPLPEAIQSVCKHIKSVCELVYLNHLRCGFSLNHFRKCLTLFVNGALESEFHVQLQVA